MKVLVTGSAGFIGFHLTEKLISEGFTVVGIDNINDYYDTRLKFARLWQSGICKEAENWNTAVQSSKYANYRFVRLNLEDKADLMALCRAENFDVVINLAAQAGVRYSIQNPDAYVQSNVVGFLNILEVCRSFKVKHLVYASSSSVYGLNERLPFAVSHNADHPISLYAATKRANELMAHSYSHLYNIPTSGMRFFTVYGPWGRPDMAYYLFADSIKNEKPIKVFNHGKMKRDFTFIDDAVDGIVKIIEHPAQPAENWDGITPDPSISKAPFRVYNIGNNVSVELMDLINEIEKNIGKEAILEMHDMQDGDVLATWTDIESLKKYGYKPDTPIKKGIKHFVDWYTNFG
jgi:UDP-glucuronate 4-epimerase